MGAGFGFPVTEIKWRARGQIRASKNHTSHVTWCTTRGGLQSDSGDQERQAQVCELHWAAGGELLAHLRPASGPVCGGGALGEHLVSRPSSLAALPAPRKSSASWGQHLCNPLPSSHPDHSGDTKPQGLALALPRISTPRSLHLGFILPIRCKRRGHLLCLVHSGC